MTQGIRFEEADQEEVTKQKSFHSSDKRKEIKNSMRPLDCMQVKSGFRGKSCGGESAAIRSTERGNSGQEMGGKRKVEADSGTGCKERSLLSALLTFGSLLSLSHSHIVIFALQQFE